MGQAPWSGEGSRDSDDRDPDDAGDVVGGPSNWINWCPGLLNAGATVLAAAKMPSQANDRSFKDGYRSSVALVALSCGSKNSAGSFLGF